MSDLDKTLGYVYIIDDDKTVLESLKYLVNSIGYEAICFNEPQTFLQQIQQIKYPCCLLVDIRMPFMGGIELMNKLKKDQFVVPVVFMSGVSDIETAVDAMAAGAVYFLTKPINPQIFIDKINYAIRKAISWLEKTKQANLYKEKLSMLSKREIDILQLISEGYATKVIAKTLHLSPHTVDIYRSKIMQKLNIHSIAELVKLAISAQDLTHNE